MLPVTGAFIWKSYMVLPKSRIFFHSVDNYINFWFSQMAAIFDFSHNAMSNVLSNHTLCREYLKTLW